jgi:hypothetical protein
MGFSSLLKMEVNFSHLQLIFESASMGFSSLLKFIDVFELWLPSTTGIKGHVIGSSGVSMNSARRDGYNDI